MDEIVRQQQQQEILRLIAYLSQKGTAPTSEDVVKASALSPGTVVFAMGGLLSRGLIEREGLLTSDCRYRLTDAGRTLAINAQAVEAAFFHSLMNDPPPASREDLDE